MDCEYPAGLLRDVSSDPTRFLMTPCPAQFVPLHVFLNQNKVNTEKLRSVLLEYLELPEHQYCNNDMDEHLQMMYVRDSIEHVIELLENE